MNRIDLKFKELKAKKKKAFISFITAGDPNLKTTEELVLAFENKGVDIIELGVPFSDSLADGPTIQISFQRALAQKVTLQKILSMVNSIRKKSQIPIVLMTSYNPVFHYGDEKFIKAACKSGVDGLIIPDLPPEEATNILQFSKQHDLSMIFLIAPTSKPQRMKYIARNSSGFIYYVSLTGVTGIRQKLSTSYIEQVQLIKKYSNNPICVGFGVSTPQQVKSISKVADGVIVGSAIVNSIANNAGKSNLIKNVSHFVSTLTSQLIPNSDLEKNPILGGSVK